GPVSFVLLGKFTTDQRSRSALLNAIVPIYREALTQLHHAGADWVQVDEPCLVLDLDPSAQELYSDAYGELLKRGPLPQVLLATYFGSLGENLEIAASLPVQGLHVDLVRAPEQLEAVLKATPSKMLLCLGVVDGRNIWRTDLIGSLRKIRRAVEV